MKQGLEATRVMQQKLETPRRLEHRRQVESRSGAGSRRIRSKRELAPYSSIYPFAFPAKQGIEAFRFDEEPLLARASVLEDLRRCRGLIGFQRGEPVT